MIKKRVVITGMGAVTPIGLCVESFWKNAVEGVCGIAPITRFDTEGFRVKLCAEVRGFEADKYFDKMEARKLDLYAQYCIAAADEAVADSGIVGLIEPERLGVYVGSGIGGICTMANCQDVLRERGPSRVSAAMVPMMIGNIACAHIAIRFKAKGVSLPIVTACATGAHSIGEAFRAIQMGYADAIIAGGGEASINPLAVAGFQNMMALCCADDPSAASIPFDKRRGGFVMGEGAGILVLEEYEHAVARGAKIYCEITGYANTCDAYHVTAPCPDAEGYIRMLRELSAFIDAGEKIYFNLHGTGTELNDKTESLAIKTVFGNNHLCSSTKSMTGHLLGATGAVEAIVAAKVLCEDVVPPTINLCEPDPECDLDYCANCMRQYHADVAISANLGFGGHNAGLVFRRVK